MHCTLWFCSRVSAEGAGGWKVARGEWEPLTFSSPGDSFSFKKVERFIYIWPVEGNELDGRWVTNMDFGLFVFHSYFLQVPVGSEPQGKRLKRGMAHGMKVALLLLCWEKMLQGLHSLNLWARVSQFTLAFVATKSLPKHFKYFEVLSASILVCKVIFLFFFFFARALWVWFSVVFYITQCLWFVLDWHPILDFFFSWTWARVKPAGFVVPLTFSLYDLLGNISFVLILAALTSYCFACGMQVCILYMHNTVPFDFVHVVVHPYFVWHWLWCTWSPLQKFNPNITDTWKIWLH